ncbi:hypothetical protein RBH29_00315 [Herbivorax sp. ANBcel31]|uniref:hypothetical protein n=1 Tax=Herbivorax sp. ANBcel31 TaxID=3069754 RepID=UPI0027B2C958|nr:hypothetical protein [Herbivorax sp. ANBcel31]MDQ2084879.1 hypothetical protein [Herbivorax sp. ANBcel31]
MVDKVVKILEEHGPMTGKELQQKSQLDDFCLWKICNTCGEITTKAIGKRYLRFDKQVEGYARLSPSIVREFYSYTVIGTKRDIGRILEKTEVLCKNIIDISKNKFNLAYETIRQIVETHENSEILNKYICFLIAGDVVFEMAHLEPRPESSTGKLVKGSDLDIVVVTKGLPDSIVNNIDALIYDKKNFLLKNPDYNEEIDYVVKDISKIKQQLKFDNFKAKIASKVLFESKYLYGNSEMYKKIKQMVKEAGIPQKMVELEEKAEIERNDARIYLLKSKAPLSEEESLKLFYTKEEKEEFF